jgi:cysteinyl-tRNA synthetase
MTAPIGHNRTAVELFSDHVADLFALVSGSTAAEITSDEQEAVLDELLDQVRQAAKDANAKRVEEKRPHDEAAKAVQAQWKPVLDRCEAALDAIKDRLTPYRTAKQKAKDEAARVARELAAQQLAEAQAKLAQSDDLEARFGAEAGLAAAAKLTVKANRIDRAATGLRTHWTHTVTDRRALLNYVAKNDPDALATALDEWARQAVARGVRQIPGCLIEERKRAA